MLYIFHVDTGRMLTFDMNLALESVQYLKETIEKHHALPATSQVLLVSGGEMLQPNARVCSYSAGTDTNPIYMFSTTIIESQNPPKPWPSIDPGKKISDTDLKEQLDQCLALPATYSTVVSRAQLAQQIYEMAKNETRICEKLVHEQHLQQQGWAAVVANMEDITDEFKVRCNDFYRSFDEHLERRQQYLDFVSHFNNDLDKLSKIPILPALMRNAEEKPFHAFDDYLNDSESYSKAESAIETSQINQSRGATPESGSGSGGSGVVHSGDSVERKIKTLSLLQWISASENQKSLRHLAQMCSRGLQLFDEKAMSSLKFEAQKAIDAAEQDNMKEIKGLEDRLCGLEKLMFDARKIVQEQSELAQAFQQNQTRANNLGDASILPDLCASHRSQLVVMVRNHKLLKDIRRRVTRAKEELATNLNKRLKYVVYIENRMYDIDNSLLFYHRCLRRLQRHLEIIEQIHQAPCMYVSAVTEVVRRRLFSNAFLMWASELACQLLTFYNDEVMRRQDFSSLFEGHFLSTLFPGMDDMPPTYATETPVVFDSGLPPLTKDDINVLSMQLPEITSNIKLPDLGAVIEFFSSRSGNLKSQEEKSHSSSSDIRALSSGIIDEETINLKPIELHSHLKDYERGFESETDTEEFEKVGQSPIERRHNQNLNATATGTISQTTSATSTTINLNLDNQTLPLLRPDTCTISTSTDVITTKNNETLTEDNLGSTRIEVERLKSLLKTMYELSHNSLSLLKEQLNNVKMETNLERTDLEIKFNLLKNTWNKIENDTKINERESINRLTVDHELELNDIKKSIMNKDDEIETLKTEKNNMNELYTEQIINYENDKEKLKDTINGLTENIKCLDEQIIKEINDKEKAVNDMKEKLIHEHKTEIESLRCRFKLMTSMERSPSDTSLEKIERPDCIEITSHESILIQTKVEMEHERDLAIKSAVERERARNELRSSGGGIYFSGSPKSPSQGHQDLFKRILDEKDKQLDALREREIMLVKENNCFKQTIQTLADSEPYESQMSMLKNQFDGLQNDNARLEQELEMEKSRRIEMEKSVTAIKSNEIKDAATSPDQTRPRSRQSNSSSQSSVIKTNICFDSCSKGDQVLVVWNSTHGQYTIIQLKEDTNLYFLHGDSYIGLNLTAANPDGSAPKIIYCIGVVVEKEYCHARKDENRYKVSRGTKFYRVKVRPRSPTVRPNELNKCKQKKEKLEAGTTPPNNCESVSRSTSTDKYNQQFQLIDSFAQTEYLDPVIEDTASCSKDMIDSGVVTQQKSIYKERNISITEEDEPIIQERCRCVSVCEDDEILTEQNRNTERASGTGLFTLIETLFSPTQF